MFGKDIVILKCQLSYNTTNRDVLFVKGVQFCAPFSMQKKEKNE
nr:MAG TPA: hypothetical protein [Caudoviricetes sp.]